MEINIVKKGTWLYDGQIEKPVDIIALEYDFWYEIAKADGMLEPDEQPGPFGSNGELYYVRFQRALEKEGPTWVDSIGHPNIDEAIEIAKSKVTGEIRWEQ